MLDDHSVKPDHAVSLDVRLAAIEDQQMVGKHADGDAARHEQRARVWLERAGYVAARRRQDEEDEGRAAHSQLVELSTVARLAHEESSVRHVHEGDDHAREVQPRRRALGVGLEVWRLGEQQQRVEGEAVDDDVARRRLALTQVAGGAGHEMVGDADAEDQGGDDEVPDPAIAAVWIDERVAAQAACKQDVPGGVLTHRGMPERNDKFALHVRITKNSRRSIDGEFIFWCVV